MTNKFFPDEQITENDLYFLCFMIERVARKLCQRNKYVVNRISKDEWERLISLPTYCIVRIRKKSRLNG